jgi:hypothetical protein
MRRTSNAAQLSQVPVTASHADELHLPADWLAREVVLTSVLREPLRETSVFVSRCLRLLEGGARLIRW